MELFKKDATEMPRYTNEALDLNMEAKQALEAAARPYLAAGASIRDVALILMHSVFELECEMILTVPVGKTLQEHLTEN